MMMMLGPEGAQLPGVTPAGADTATGGPRPVPRPAPPRPAPDTSPDHPEGDTYRGERERDGEKTYMVMCKL
jgi:hypothetical protein